MITIERSIKKEFFFTAFLMIDGKIVVKSAEQIDIYLN